MLTSPARHHHHQEESTTLSQGTDSSPLRQPLLDAAQPPLHRPLEAVDEGGDDDDDEDDKNKNEKLCWVDHKLIYLQRNYPAMRNIARRIRKVPRKYKIACFVVWVLWKCIATFLVVYLLKGAIIPTTTLSSSSNEASVLDPTATTQQHPLRVLYIVTSLAEYNTGTRNTRKGQDRLQEVMLPIVVDSIESMLQMQYQVDLYLILAYKLRPEREAYIRSQLPATVGLQVWGDACPIGYDKRQDTMIKNNTRALARQHRYVIKDKMLYYDLFMSWEDDMRVTGFHVEQYMRVSRQIDQLRRKAALDQQPELPPEPVEPDQQLFHGSLSTRQLDRLIPGFIRVEVLLNETAYGAQTELDNIPLSDEPAHFDSKYCCHVDKSKSYSELPHQPPAQDVVLWETNIKALSVRKLPPTKSSPSLDWVALLPGPGKRLEPNDFIGGYWSGRHSTATKPSPGMPDLIAQQGGWMATRDQIYRLHHGGFCQGTFLPPFDEPVYYQDGQESMNVEFWSGGYQLFTGVKGGCNMQRIVELSDDSISKHFLYHVANNKQRQLSRQRMVRATHLVQQLNSVVKAANDEITAQSKQ